MGHSQHRRIVIHDRFNSPQTAPSDKPNNSWHGCDSDCTTDDGKHWKRPRSSFRQQQNQCQIVEQEKYTHIPMSFTSRLHCSKRGPRFEWQNVPVPHETTLIDKIPSIYRQQLCPNFGKVWDLLIFHLMKLIFRRRTGKPQLMDSVFPGTFIAGRSARTGSLHDHDARLENRRK